MSYLKKRLAVFLCMVIAFTTIFVVVPQETVQAATVTLKWAGSSAAVVQVEKGASDLYIGDYINAYEKKTDAPYGPLSFNSGVKYTSSNKTVATVHSTTGKLTAKKTGTTTIKAKFKGATISVKIKVVSSLEALRDSDYYRKWEEAAASKFVKSVGNAGVTTKNRYSALTAYVQYKKSGFYKIDGCRYSKSGGKSICSIYMPICGRAYAIWQQIELYGKTRNPYGTVSSKWFSVKSVSGSGQTITINLKKAVTAEQIYGANFDNIYYRRTEKTNAKKVTREVRICQGSSEYCTGIATIKQGSKKITVKLSGAKLKKGKEYYVVDPNSKGYWLHWSWSEFTAK